MDRDRLRDFEPIFYPKSIAVVGASGDERKTGNLYLRGLLHGGFRGKLFAVNSTGGEILGLRVYPSLGSVPESVDYVIVNIPKRAILGLLDECSAKKARVAQIFSAGFSEAGDEEGCQLEQDIVGKARALGIRIVGPNCIGVYNPAHRMSPAWVLPPQAWESGGVAFLCQSGGNTGFFIDLGLSRGIRFSKAVSFGNGADLDGLDFLEYFGVDSETKIIGAYLEGTKDGPRLLRLIRQISRTKPIVIWKGGTTDPGARAAASHTASLAGSDTIWRAGLRQAGAVKVDSLEELGDTVLAFQQLPGFEGTRVGIVSGLFGAGGGAAVALCDACVHRGLEVPVLADETIAGLKSILPAEGSIFQNPVDVGAIAARSLAGFAQALGLVARDPRLDLVVVHVPVRVLLFFMGTESYGEFAAVFADVRKTEGKPIVIVTQSGAAVAEGAELEHRYAEARIPVYPTFEEAAGAIGNVSRYWRDRAAQGQDHP